MNKLKILSKKYIHIWPVLYVFIYIPWFNYVEDKVVPYYNVHTVIDDYIPFCEYFIIPYMLWFAYVAIPIVYLFFKDVETYYSLVGFLIAGMTVFLVISTLFPNGQVLRPYSFPRDNMFTDAVRWLYAADTPTNILPSIHVFNALGVHLAICKSPYTRSKKAITSASAFIMVMIILSTMFLKQHSVIDVAAAFIMAGIFLCLVKTKDSLHYIISQH